MCLYLTCTVGSFTGEREQTVVAEMTMILNLLMFNMNILADFVLMEGGLFDTSMGRLRKSGKQIVGRFVRSGRFNVSIR